VRRRGRWPSSQQRYCTSDFKRAPIDKVITRVGRRAGLWRYTRVLNVMGLRASESPARAKRQPFEIDRRRSNSRRRVETWLPIFRLSTSQVWALIRQHGLEMHPAYTAGMPRLSCRFCIFSPREALLRAGAMNPELLEEYVTVERETGHSFRADLRLADIQAALARGVRATSIQDWRM
jgi:3'-phosphoadenosine 5'-phosphosulfate sulfotransferase (PAPS reductase)/FAD synthetase